VITSRQDTIAILFDCDDTLAEDTTTLVVEELGFHPKEFWRDISRMVSQGWDPPIAYMTKLLWLSRERGPALTRGLLRSMGRKITFSPGIPGQLEALREFVTTHQLLDGQVKLKTYIISSGFEEVIRGSTLPKYVDDIFAGNFEYDKRGRAVSPKSTVTFTEKTKFVHAISKGISGKMLRQNPYKVNDVIEESNRVIPWENILYVGDGPSDVPCLSMIKRLGGHTIGVFPPKGSELKAYQLAVQGRTNVGPYERDFRPRSQLRRMMETIMLQVGLKIVEAKKTSTITP